MANEQNLKPINSVDVAREMQKKSAQKRKQNNAEKKLIRERILERMSQADWDAYIDGIIQRAKESKSDAEFLRDTIGEKPIEKQEVSVTDVSHKLEDVFSQLGGKELEE